MLYFLYDSNIRAISSFKEEFWNTNPLKKTILIYGVVLAAGTIFLKSIEYFYLVRIFPLEIYITLIAIAFVGLGIWVGQKLTSPKQVESAPFQRNHKALESLGISDRELDVLDLLGKGHSNREIADKLFISVNTVKTHLAHLYEKLGVNRRSMAVRKARSLRLIS